MNPNIPGSGNPSAGAPIVQTADASGFDGLSGDAAALKLSLKTGAKAANRKADNNIIDTYAGIKGLLSKDALAMLSVEIKEAQFAAALSKTLSGDSPNTKAAAAQLLTQFSQWCQSAGVRPNPSTFAAFAEDMRAKLTESGVPPEHQEAAFDEASRSTQSFALSSTMLHTRSNV